MNTTYSTKALAKRGLVRLMKRCEFVKSGEVVEYKDRYGLDILVDNVSAPAITLDALEKDHFVRYVHTEPTEEVKENHLPESEVLVTKNRVKRDSKREVKNASFRPLSGSVTGCMWDLFDYYYSLNQILKAVDLRRLANENSWNINTVRTQFVAWKKFNGLTK